jgi:hypothetical protein
MPYFGSYYTGPKSASVDAYTNFPKFCCRCLKPSPEGTWPVKLQTSKTR